MRFVYEKAFKRNLGLLSLDELHSLKNKRVALPGLGGVGGSHLISLTRLGLQNYHIADFDEFDLGNFNRQYGANLSTIGKSKCSVMLKEALKINPNLNIKVFENGVNDENLDDFLSGVDLLIDTIDVFSQKTRRKIINRALKHKIPVISAGPLGFGTGYFSILPNTVSYDDFFQLNDSMSDLELMLHFLIGLSPKLHHVKYLIPEYINIDNGDVPSSMAGINLASGVTVTEAIKILLNRPGLLPLPYTHQFDPYSNKYSKVKLSRGNKSLFQKLKIHLMKKKFLEKK